MLREFATRSPKGATGVIYAGGYLAGSLLGALLDRLISGRVEGALVAAFGICAASIAIFWARRRGIVPEPEELNRPITLFGSDRPRRK